MSDKSASISGQLQTELLIIGGGIMGLWAALQAERRGIRTMLVDAGAIAGGASGGLLGALMPYMPDKWDAKKQLQFDALVSLEAEIADLEAATGLSAGYRRSGRLIPLPKPHLRVIAERHSKDALRNWHQGNHQFFWNPLDGSPCGDGWPADEFAVGGLVQDTFAARVSPRGLTHMLARRLEQAARVAVTEGLAIEAIDAATSTAVFRDGTKVAFGHLVVATGHHSFDLLSSIGPALAKPLGQPVKGQAALLKAEIAPDLPLLYLDGLYIVPHEGGQVAIGSTSENHFNDATSTDVLLDDLLLRACRLAPVLEDAEIVERWAGLRPKAIDRDPMVGIHPDAERVIALTGGFKVSFGLAHVLANAALDAVEGKAMALPDSFSLAHHIRVAVD